MQMKNSKLVLVDLSWPKKVERKLDSHKPTVCPPLYTLDYNVHSPLPLAMLGGTDENCQRFTTQMLKATVSGAGEHFTQLEKGPVNHMEKLTLSVSSPHL